MSVRSIGYDSIKGMLSEEMRRKVEKFVNTKGRYIANIETDLRYHDPGLANDFIDECKEAQYEIRKEKSKNRGM